METTTVELKVVIEPDEGMFHAYVPALPGCHTFGATIDETLVNIREAMSLYIETLLEGGEPIPVEQEPMLITRLPVAIAV
jgi:predicted RNase H-like HicB family nuclease